jgi:hypothetical protein
MPILNFQNIAPIGSGSANTAFAPAPKTKSTTKRGGRRMGYKRLAENRKGTVKEMKAAIQAHNKRYCISTAGNKATLAKKMKRVDKKLSTISKTGSGANQGGGGTKGQKNAAKTMTKLASAYGTLGIDANPEYAFTT